MYCAGSCEVLMQVTDDLKQLYDDNVVVELVTLSASSQTHLSRHSRSLLADTKSTNEVGATLRLVILSLSLTRMHSVGSSTGFRRKLFQLTNLLGIIDFAFVS